MQVYCIFALANRKKKTGFAKVNIFNNMKRKKIGKKLDAPKEICRTLESEFGVTRQTVTNALAYRTYSPSAEKIRARAVELGAELVDRYIWVEDERAAI